MVIAEVRFTETPCPSFVAVTRPKFVGGWRLRRTTPTGALPGVVGFWVRHVVGGGSIVRPAYAEN